MTYIHLFMNCIKKGLVNFEKKKNAQMTKVEVYTQNHFRKKRSLLFAKKSKQCIESVCT